MTGSSGRVKTLYHGGQSGDLRVNMSVAVSERGTWRNYIRRSKLPIAIHVFFFTLHPLLTHLSPSTQTSTFASSLPRFKMTSDCAPYLIYEEAPTASKNAFLQEDEYKVPVVAVDRHQPRLAVSAQASPAIADGRVDADDEDYDDEEPDDENSEDEDSDDEDSDDESICSNHTVCTIAPSRSSTPRPGHSEAPTARQPFLDDPIYDFNSRKYITTIKIGQERVSCGNISPSFGVEVRTFYAATSKDDGPDRTLSPLRGSPIVWECAILHTHKCVQVSTYWDRKSGSIFSFPWYWKSLEYRLQAELDIDGYRVDLKRALPRAYHEFHIDPRDAPTGRLGPMASSPKPSVRRLPQSKFLSRRGRKIVTETATIVARVVSV